MCVCVPIGLLFLTPLNNAAKKKHICCLYKIAVDNILKSERLADLRLDNFVPFTLYMLILMPGRSRRRNLLSGVGPPCVVNFLT